MTELEEKLEVVHREFTAIGNDRLSSRGREEVMERLDGLIKGMNHRTARVDKLDEICNKRQRWTIWVTLGTITCIKGLAKKNNQTVCEYLDELMNAEWEKQFEW